MKTFGNVLTGTKTSLTNQRKISYNTFVKDSDRQKKIKENIKKRFLSYLTTNSKDTYVSFKKENNVVSKGTDKPSIV